MNTRFRTCALVISLASSLAGVRPAESQTGTTLVDVVRSATADFRDSNAAIAAGWMPLPACVSGPERGAMGIHFVKPDLVGDGELDAQNPEALIYEQKNNRLRLLGVEYIVLADGWHANHADPPVLLGQQFHYVGSPNRYGLPAFYELHVWAWRHNPSGTFADWNPRVSCEEFTTQDASHAHH